MCNCCPRGRRAGCECACHGQRFIPVEGELPLFSDPASCVKCGQDDIAATYEKGCGGHQGCTWHPEKIRRLCRRCRFAWDERPLA